MELFRRIFFAAVLAGAVAGLASAAIQQWRVVPLILEAELYEIDDAHALEHAADAVPAAPHVHEAEEAEPWAPADGFERTFYTVLATLLTGLAFGLVLAAISVLMGMPVTLGNSVYWGLGGFVTFSLMPAIGLSPELPGMVAADLATRQIWWWGTVLATGIALLSLAKMRNLPGLAIAIVILLIPHIVGAPLPPDEPSDVPAHLATAFAANALFSSLAFWLILSAIYGWLADRTNREGAR